MISSIQNKRVKQWSKLHTKKERMRTNSFIIEGFHAIEEAIKSKWQIKEVIVAEDITVPDWCEGLSMQKVNQQVFQHVAQTKTPQGIAAVVEMKEQTIDVKSIDSLLLIDAVQDPGNLGTLIRTADAAGFSAIYIGEGTVDIYNDKVIRATQGSIFHIPVISTNLHQKTPLLIEEGFDVWAGDLQGASYYTDVDMKQKVALIVGNEGAGIQDSLLSLANTKVKIPIYGQAESLNVSVAAGILMYKIKELLA